MKLYLVHAGFYDDDVSGGFYESHTNYFVAAEDVKKAKKKAKAIPEYKDKKMHIDGIMDVGQVDGYEIVLHPVEDGTSDRQKQYGYDDVKSIDS